MARSARLSPTATDRELVAAAQSGNADAFDRLVDRYRRFVRSRSRGYFIVGGDRQDLEQEALIGFYKSVRDFDPALGAPFRPFAELCIGRQVITAIKTANRMKHQPLNRAVSFSAPRPGSDADEHDDDIPAVADPHAGPAEQLVALEQIDGTHEALLSTLSSFEINVLAGYVEGRSYELIAGELGRHAKAVDNAIQRIKRKLTTHLQTRETEPALA